MNDRRFQLRPRSMGELLDDNFRIYREKFRFLIISGVCILLPFNILNAYITSHYGLLDFQNQLKQFRTGQMVGTTPPVTFSQIFTPAVIWAYVIIFISSLLVAPLLYGMVVHMLTKHYLDGTDVSLGDASTHAFRRLVPNILTIVFLYIVLIFAFVLVGIVFALFAALSKAIAVLMGILAFIVLLCLAVWVMVRLSPIQSVIMEENRMMLRSIVRAWVLSKRNFWRLLGYFLLLFIIVGILRAAVTFAANVFIHQPALLAIAVTVIDALTLPLLMVGTANIYLDLRIRKDGLDFIQS